MITFFEFIMKFLLVTVLGTFNRGVCKKPVNFETGDDR